MPYSMCGALVALALGLPLTATAGPARSQKDAAEAARARRAGKSSVSPVRSAATPGRSAPALDELSARRRTSSGANYSGSVARGGRFAVSPERRSEGVGAGLKAVRLVRIVASFGFKVLHSR